MRPMQEPMSSMGTKRPEAMALPAAQTAPRKYTTSMVTRAAYPNSLWVPLDSRCLMASSPAWARLDL